MSLIKFLEKAPSARVLVIGDLILDRYFIGDAHRISPEAPVPVVHVERVKNVPGGASNTAMNLKGLGVDVSLSGAVGDDVDGDLFLGLLMENGFSNRFIFRKRGLTTVKVRIIARNQHVLRVDFEEVSPVSSEVAGALDRILRDNRFDVIVVSDYAKGMITPQVMDVVRRNGGVIFVDPKGRDWEKYRGVDFITPNIRELSEAVGVSIENSDEDVEKWGREVLRKYGFRHVVITRSDRGISLITEDEAIHVPTHAQEVFDVSGAGDTAVAALVYGWMSGMDYRQMLSFANVAAGLVIRKLGTYAVSRDEIMEELRLLQMI